MSMAFSRARSVSSSSVPEERIRHAPEASQNANPNLMPGTALTSGLDEMRLPENEIDIFRFFNRYCTEFRRSAHRFHHSSEMSVPEDKWVAMPPLFVPSSLSVTKKNRFEDRRTAIPGVFRPHG